MVTTIDSAAIRCSPQRRFPSKAELDVQESVTNQDVIGQHAHHRPAKVGTSVSVEGVDPTHLRVLIANEKRERLELVAQVVITLGHEVIAREIYVNEVGAVTARERPDVALVGLGSSSEHALELIGEIVREATCPVIALLEKKDPEYVNEAATRGVFAYIVDGDPDELQNAISITLRRFAEYQNLQGAFGRRAKIEQAKGILMARHGIDEDQAFEMLRTHSNRNGRKLVDVAEAVVESHLLLLPPGQRLQNPEQQTGASGAPSQLTSGPLPG
jgi:AmiR/NasT family two-component response regulator